MKCAFFYFLYVFIFIGALLSSDANGVKFDFDSSLLNENQTIDIVENRFVYPGVFSVDVAGPVSKGSYRWELIVYDRELKIVDKVRGAGLPSKKIIWVKQERNRKIFPDTIYFYKFVFFLNDSFIGESEIKGVFIRSVPAIKYRIPMDDLTSYKRFLSTREGNEFIRKVRDAMKSHPDEMLYLTGYVSRDSIDVCENIARLRNYLMAKTDAPPKRFKINCEIFDEDFEENRFVSIIGIKKVKNVKTQDLKREVARINSVIGDARFHFYKLSFRGNSGVLEVKDNENSSRASISSKPGFEIDLKYLKRLNLRRDVFVKMRASQVEYRDSETWPLKNKKSTLFYTEVGFRHRNDIRLSYSAALGAGQALLLYTTSARDNLELTESIFIQFVPGFHYAFFQRGPWEIKYNLYAGIISPGTARDLKVKYGAMLKSDIEMAYRSGMLKYSLSPSVKGTYRSTDISSQTNVNYGAIISLEYGF